MGNVRKRGPAASHPYVEWLERLRQDVGFPNPRRRQKVADGRSPSEHAKHLHGGYERADRIAAGRFLEMIMRGTRARTGTPGLGLSERNC